MPGQVHAVVQQPAPDDVEVAERGAAAMSYARLQFEDITPELREQIEQATLRYWALDTFAMIIIDRPAVSVL